MPTTFFKSSPVLAALVACAACVSGHSSQTPADNSAGPLPTLAVDHYTLNNGLHVFLHEDHRTPVVAVNVWYHVGSRHERAQRTGFAHLFEHLMFQGSAHVGEDQLFRLLEQAGASDVNGTTSQDRTNYYEVLPAEELPLALWLESDRMGFLLDTLTQGRLDNQRSVVHNERRQSFESRPYGQAYLALYRGLFPGSHPYHQPPIGVPQDLDAATLADVREFFLTHYTPANASLVIAGDFDPTQTRALVEKAFGGLKGRPAPLPPPTPAPLPAPVQTRTTLKDPLAPLPQVTLAWVTPPLFETDDLVLDLVGNILSAGKNSRLYQAVVNSGLAQDASAGESSMTLASIFSVEATVAPGKDPAEVETALSAVLTTLGKDGPTAAELHRAQDLVETQMLLSLEQVGHRADLIQSFWDHQGTPDYLATLLKRYRTITPAQVQDVVTRRLALGHAYIQTVVPSPATADSAAPAAAPTSKPAAAPANPAAAAPSPGPNAPLAAEPWRQKPPVTLKLPPPVMPTVSMLPQPGGLTLVHVHLPGLPLVGLGLVSRAGAARDPADKLGRSALAAQMLTEGIAGGDAAGLARAFAELGTQVSSVGGLEASQLSTVVHVRHAAKALNLMVQMVTQPTLDPAALERARTRMTTGLTEQLAQPIGVATYNATPLLLGSHPLAHPRSGSAQGLAHLTVEDVRAALAQGWTAGATAVVVAGDLNQAAAVALVQPVLGAFAAGGALPPLPPVPPVDDGGVRLFAVDFPGAAQTVVTAVGPAPAVLDPTLPALELSNAVLGGMFSSRLNLKLREERGISYGAQSVLQPFSVTGMLMALAPVEAQATDVALKDVLHELDDLVATPPRPEELDLARRSYARSLPGEFTGVGRVSGIASRMYALSMPGDYYATLPRRYAAVTAQQAVAAAARWVTPNGRRVLLVGDRARIEAAAKAVGLVPTWLAPDGKPL